MDKKHYLVAGVIAGTLVSASLAPAHAQLPDLVTALKVFVTNTPDDPVPVRDVDLSRRELYQATYGGALAEGEANGCLASFEVPAGKRLMVEYVTLLADARTDQAVTFSLAITNSDNTAYVHHAINAHRTEPGSLWYIASDPLKAYGGPGSLVCLSVSRNASPTDGLVNASFTVSGYLVDVP
jgi:hypothetical protein